MEEVKAFSCIRCNKIYKGERDAYECEFKHAQEEYANCLLREGHNLEHINWCCGFNWNLTEEQKKITHDNCFIISHWQCCEKPAYRITGIDRGGFVRVWGCGSWNGYYGNTIQVSNLPKPHPKEELFIDERYARSLNC